MNAMVFDTHNFVKRLTAEGMPIGQAEVLADEQARLIDTRLITQADLAQIVTKEDLSSNVTGIKIELAALKADVTFLKWASGLVLAGISSLILKTFF
ncbi:DUF1640 domain-containing protein [Bordetella genomosp. 4]|uniref:DUF1640 domain-containing protein n=1 Tax=Bordetella genomosp. 4 TaxID=463044 RepID=A0A261V0G8_9BORD|nr:DUF1640 domain-containing protein [Bordetella genomosp. 4]OZI41720.1 hypothetical protein CAL21_23405 [Bordetella genomosp. 4]OZI67648.1 hypothetical protein CAL20_00970 [Bordetella genomosp. 4]